MARRLCSQLIGWNQILTICVLIIIWVFWGLRYLNKSATDDVLSSVAAVLSAPASEEPGLRPLVLYTYAESENARANLYFFLRNGLHGNADFVFIFNGETNAPDMIPEAPNIRIVRRENKCYDIGAMGEILRQDDLWKKYKRFITMNASIRGPFFPVHSPSCWTDKFLGRITDKVKVGGPSHPATLQFHTGGNSANGIWPHCSSLAQPSTAFPEVICSRCCWQPTTLACPSFSTPT